jgi:hypothetical protein
MFEHRKEFKSEPKEQHSQHSLSSIADKSFPIIFSTSLKLAFQFPPFDPLNLTAAAALVNDTQNRNTKKQGIKIKLEWSSICVVLSMFAFVLIDLR